MTFEEWWKKQEERLHRAGIKVSPLIYQLCMNAWLTSRTQTLEEEFRELKETLESQSTQTRG